jgi:hypothetical protein
MMKDYHINVFYNDDDGCYVADIPDLKYCSVLRRKKPCARCRSPRPCG